MGALSEGTPQKKTSHAFQEGTEAAARKIEKGDKILEIEGVAVKVGPSGLQATFFPTHALASS